MSEVAFTFSCQGAGLVGILHPGSDRAARGVLIVVGGPQYRVGSHRQFLLLARDLAAAGIPVLRFDYRGMGDAGGEAVDFEHCRDDIAAAVDAFLARCPGLREVVIWGLCDAASAALFYAWRDRRVKGLVLLNPWVRTEVGESRAFLKHYYLKRLFSADLWAKIRRGEFKVADSLGSLLAMVKTVLTPTVQARSNATSSEAVGPLPERMMEGLAHFAGPVLLILSGNDLTAAEFKDTVAASPRWRRLLRQPRITRYELPAANHTFSRREWRQQVMEWTLQWLRSW
ncbi:MAG: hydrolase 1, exosortase A system-associated [Candidatus Competibacteraceae bacterium]